MPSETRTNRRVHGIGLKNLRYKKLLFFNLKDLYFISISVIFIFWWMFKDIVENQDLHRKKDDF